MSDRRRQRDQGEDRQVRPSTRARAVVRAAASRQGEPHAERAAERIALAPGLEISRIVTGLWQVADMERDGRDARPRARLLGDARLCAGRLRQLRHGRPLRQRRAHRRALPRARRGRRGRRRRRARRLHQMVPDARADDGRESCAPASSAAASGSASKRSTSCSSTGGRFEHPAYLDAMKRARRAAPRRADPPSRRHQFRHRASARAGEARHSRRHATRSASRCSTAARPGR